MLIRQIKMKKGKDYSVFIIIATVTIVIAMIGVYGYFNMNKGVPKIDVIPDSYDFGEVPYEKVEHTFSVKNTGTARLEIEGVTTSCGCTKGTVESQTIQPGKSTNLLVTFDPNLMSEEVLGKVLRIVYIKSNDPKQPEVQVKITADVVK